MGTASAAAAAAAAAIIAVVTAQPAENRFIFPALSYELQLLV